MVFLLVWKFWGAKYFSFLKGGTESQPQMGKLLRKSLLGGTPKALCPLFMEMTNTLEDMDFISNVSLRLRKIMAK